MQTGESQFILSKPPDLSSHKGISAFLGYLLVHIMEQNEN